LALSPPTTEKEAEIVERLIQAHSHEQIAAAYLRQYRATHTAPEELMKPDSYDPSDRSDRGSSAGSRKSRGRDDFENGVWFSLNLGRKQKAEPRWILPMLCKSGGLDKRDIGAIKISETKTFVEIAQAGVEGFIAAIGPEGKIEKAITAQRLDGKPDFGAPDSKPQYKPRDKSTYKKKFNKRSDDLWQEMDQDAAPEFNPFATKPDGKKPHKKKLARAAALLKKNTKEKPKSKSRHKPRAAPKGKQLVGTGAKLVRKKRKE
ncbi:MAG: DbpA RNA binding domain-containing protein, partial [Robiginitomaculum sp.]|nr:DbpA RNA binding domain-containing protein [Robiginitomaculum sp.]